MGFVIYYSLSNGVNGYYQSKLGENQLGEYSKACVELTPSVGTAIKFPSKSVAKSNAKYFKGVINKASNKKDGTPFVVALQVIREDKAQQQWEKVQKYYY